MGYFWIDETLSWQFGLLLFSCLHYVFGGFGLVVTALVSSGSIELDDHLGMQSATQAMSVSYH